MTDEPATDLIRSQIVNFEPELALDLWYLALAEEVGIQCPVLNPEDSVKIMNQLYDARKEINDPRLSILSIHLPADASAIFIYKRPEAVLE